MSATAPDFASGQNILDRLGLPKFAPRHPGRPFVVALEGPNGVGKSTLCDGLARKLGAERCLGTDPAWFSEQFKVRMIRDAEWHASAMFFLSGCFEQMRVLRGRADRLVLMDRSMWSTLAVHAATRWSRLEALLQILGPIAEQVEVPDLTLVLDASFTNCQARIALKTGSARALDELTADAEFHARERQFYAWLGRRTPEVLFLPVDDRDPAQVVEDASALINPGIRC